MYEQVRRRHTGGMARAEARELEIALERNSPIPLYHQLARSIEAAITDGRLAPGERLENELSLTNRLGLSRPTARQAIQELVRKGLLVRKRGVGTQVVPTPFSREERLTSLNDDLISSGRTPGTRLLGYEWVPNDEAPADLSSEGATVLRIRRLRLADGHPLAILVNYLPARLEVSAEDLQARGLYDNLRRLGVNLRIAHQQVGARLLEPDEAALLEERVPAACLTASRVVYDDTGRVVESGRHVYRAPEYHIQASLVA